VKPPRLAGDTARRGVAADLRLRVGLPSKISRADVAAFVLVAIERTQYFRARVFVQA